MAVDTVSFGRRIAGIAVEQPDDPALVFYAAGAEAHVVVTWGELDAAANQLARMLAARGTTESSVVVVGLPDEPLHVIASVATWRLGACALPISPRLPMAERDRLLQAAGAFRPVVSVGRWTDGVLPDVGASDLDDLARYSPDELPDRLADPGVAMASGGTTGEPKIITERGPMVVALEKGEVSRKALLRALDVRPGQVHLVCTPMYHTNGFGTMIAALSFGDQVVLFEKFDAPRVLDAIERHRVNQMLVVPSVLQRLAEVPDIDRRDLSCLESVGYGGAPCPEWVTRRWLRLVGAEHLYHGYGATESIGNTALRGDEWLAHVGSCGRPVESDVLVVDDAGNRVAPGTIGEIFMRPHGATAPVFDYIGAEQRTLDRGFVSLGDYGWLDEDGYLYIADRRTDMIISGGANVYPAEVEAALADHPGVARVAVIGLPDETWGQRVHAIVQPRWPIDERSLEEWWRARIAPFKGPKTYEVVAEIPLTGAGKVSRARLVRERTQAVSASAPDAGSH